jgi:hypothetical protein
MRFKSKKLRILLPSNDGSYFAAHYILGLIYISSGILKLFSLNSFTISLIEFAEAYIPLRFVINNNFIIAIILCFSEICIGITCIFKNIRAISAFLFAITSLFFLYLTGANILVPPASGIIEDCGCFGEFFQLSARQSFMKSLIIFILSITNLCLIYMWRKRYDKE